MADEDAAARLAASLSATIRASASDDATLVAFFWATEDYDFAAPWTGATHYTLARAGAGSQSAVGWSGRYRVDPAALSYPVSVRAFIEELSIYYVEVWCTDAPCAAMIGRRLGFDGVVQDIARLNEPSTWTPFDVVLPRIIFAVEGCAAAHAIAAEVDALLAMQGATEIGADQATRIACPDEFQLSALP
ncbi:MAG: hypothetical protein AAF914_08965 [Pseudomonadota bacterium]